MNYRSDVAGLIYGDGSEQDNDKVVALWTRASMQELVSKMNDHDYKIIRLVTLEGSLKMQCIRLYDESIKWYDESPWVKSWETITRIAVQEYDLNVEFIRIGEDYADIAVEREGDGIQEYLSVTRSVNEDFLIAKEKETENG